jgi:hypothetical protein
VGEGAEAGRARFFAAARRLLPQPSSELRGRRMTRAQPGPRQVVGTGTRTVGAERLDVRVNTPAELNVDWPTGRSRLSRRRNPPDIQVTWGGPRYTPGNDLQRRQHHRSDPAYCPRGDHVRRISVARVGHVHPATLATRQRPAKFGPPVRRPCTPRNVLESDPDRGRPASSNTWSLPMSALALWWTTMRRGLRRHHLRRRTCR